MNLRTTAFVPQEFAHLVDCENLTDYKKLTSTLSLEEVLLYHTVNDIIYNEIFDDYQNVSRLPHNQAFISSNFDLLKKVKEKYCDIMESNTTNFGLNVSVFEGDILVCYIQQDANNPIFSLLCEIQKYFGFEAAAKTKAFKQVF